MGPIASKLKQAVVAELKKAAKNKNLQSLIKQSSEFGGPQMRRRLMDDPVADAYFQVHILSTIFLQGVGALPPLKKYSKLIDDAEEEYMPGGPPMSPLTDSYFMTWSLYDYPLNKANETIGSCQLELADIYPYTERDCQALSNLVNSRMGIYEQAGRDGSLIRLKELLTDKEYSCKCAANYKGKRGELWYVRIYDPLPEIASYSIAGTTPYILVHQTKKDWKDYLQRTLAKVKPVEDKDTLHCLFKYGLAWNYWHEFVMNGYAGSVPQAVYLAGIPDMKSTLPHAR